MQHKAFSADFKLADKPGDFRAVFATFGVVDHDQDILLPGCLQEGKAVKISSFGHSWNVPPVGIGTIHSDARQAWVDGSFFLDTIAGQEHYAVAKRLGADQ